MTGEDATTGMAVSAVVPVFPPSILTFAMTGGESAAAAEAAASLSSLAFLFGGIVGEKSGCGEVAKWEDATDGGAGQRNGYLSPLRSLQNSKLKTPICSSFFVSCVVSGRVL